MPSYKFKYESIVQRLEIMEQRILIDESILLKLKEEIDNLRLKNSSAEESDSKHAYAKSQIVLAINEIEELCFSKRRLSPNAASSSPEAMYEQMISALHFIAKMLRDSHIRAKTLTDLMRKQPNQKIVTPPGRVSPKSVPNPPAQKRNDSPDGEHKRQRSIPVIPTRPESDPVSANAKKA